MSKKAQKRAARRRAQLLRQQQQQRHRPGNPERAAELRRWRANKRRAEQRKQQPRPESEPPGWYLPDLQLTRECRQTVQPERPHPPIIRRQA